MLAIGFKSEFKIYLTFLTGPSLTYSAKVP